MIIFLTLLLFSCGYSITNRASLTIDSIKIGKIVNKTAEPTLQDALNTALMDEFQRRGVVISDGSDNIIEAEITGYKLELLSEKNGIGFEYQTTVKVDFKFKRSGKDIEYKGITSPSIDYFAAQGSLNSTIAQKQLSDKQAMDGIAFYIVTQLSLKHGDTP